MCTDEEEYREFFDLPLSIYLRHPLCLSIGHKKHGQSMFTGWPREPRHLSQRVNEDNNILFETWTSNVAKQNMSGKDCKILRGSILDFKLSRPELNDNTNDPNSAAFPKRNSDVKFENLTDDDAQLVGLEFVIEVDIDKEDEKVEEGDDNIEA
jgi:hypothetical protein